MDNLLELVMIVKNSGEVLRKCLQSVKPYISKWTILDTGSIDNTPNIIKDEMAGIPGNLYHEPFINFSASRNRSLDLASGLCKYMIVLDDSYEVHGVEKLCQLLKKSNDSSFTIRIGSINGNTLQSYYYSLRITKTDSNLRYRSRIHEYILDEKTHYIRDTDIYINDISDADHTIRSRTRFRKDIDLLMMEYGENSKDPRTLMYLARTHSLLNNYQQSVHYMNEIIDLGNIDKEFQFYAHYEKACLEFGEIDHDDEKFKKNLIRIQQKFPERAEPFYKLAIFLYESRNYQTVSKIMEKLIIFPVPELYSTILETLVYDYYIPYLYIDTNLKLGKFDKAVPQLRKILDKYPYDQPLLNIKYAICDKSMFKVEALSNKKTLVIHTGSINWEWHPLTDKKISGSEHMAMNMAKEFVRLGYRTFIFGTFESEEKGIDYQGMYDGIQYIDYKFFPEFSTKYIIDYLIVSRFVSNLVYYDNIINVYLWVHDVLPHMSKNSPIIQTHAQKFRGALVLSNWHKDYVSSHTGIPDSLVKLTRNAIYASRFTKDIQKIPFRFVYISDPSRGLHHLIDIIPIIKKKYPMTTLSIFTRIEHIEEKLLADIKSLDYVDLQPRISQDKINEELLKSDIWLYPTDFQETYCISALEAMAAGCLVVSVKYAGLIDTVGDRGIMCEHPIEKNKDNLIDKLFFVLDRPEIKKRYVDKAREWAHSQTYENLAKEWMRMFRED